MSLLAIRATTDANSAEQKRQQDRKKNILVLINQFLVENGYIDTAERLQSESNALTSKFTTADNVDLSSILIDYESYYEIRFDKKPKLIRKLNEGEENSNGLRASRPPPGAGGGSKSSSSGSSKAKKGESGNNSSSEGGGGTKFPSLTNPESSSSAERGGEKQQQQQGKGGGDDFSITGTTFKGSNNNNSDSSKELIVEEKFLKPPPNFFGDSELKQLANVISREIYQESPNIRFSDIIHLEEAKRLLVEAVQLPLRFPTLFTGILRPWRGILLHGPPGTGKTLLAKAVATECNTTFFNISASTLISKWRGDSEKLVRVLFDLARYHAPSTIFLDEIDSILTSRDSNDHGGGEHEASRRMKTELLIQLDGISSSKGGKGGPPPPQVFVMAASNLPWELDIALLRRLEKRVLVSLPCEEAREMMFRKHLADRVSSDVNFSEIAQLTEGYSGADLELVCRESAMMPVRRLITKIDAIGGSDGNSSSSSLLPDPPLRPNNQAATKRPSGAGAIGLKNSLTATQHDIDTFLRNDPVNREDIMAALATTKPSSDGKITKYEAWQKEFGSV